MIYLSFFFFQNVKVLKTNRGWKKGEKKDEPTKRKARNEDLRLIKMRIIMEKKNVPQTKNNNFMK